MRTILPSGWLAASTFLLAAPPARSARVEIPNGAGWKIEAPAGFDKASGSECKEPDRLCFTKGRAVLAVNPVDTTVPRCGWANEGFSTNVKDGSVSGRQVCEALFPNGNKSYRIKMYEGKFMELLFRFKLAATDADNGDAQQAFDEIKSTLEPPPPPPKPKEAPPKAAAPAEPAVVFIPVPDSSGWHFAPSKVFELDEPDTLRFAKLKRTVDGVTAWIDFQFAGSRDEMCAHGGERVGELYESLRWDHHSIRGACADPFGKSAEGRRLVARSAEFMIEIEPDRYVRARLHYTDAELRSVDDADLPPDLKKQAEKTFERVWRTLAPKGIELTVND